MQSVTILQHAGVGSRLSDYHALAISPLLYDALMDSDPDFGDLADVTLIAVPVEMFLKTDGKFLLRFRVKIAFKCFLR